MIENWTVKRPRESKGNDSVWWNGWEVVFDSYAHKWFGHGWLAYKGGVDPETARVSASTFSECLDEIEEREL